MLTNSSPENRNNFQLEMREAKPTSGADYLRTTFRMVLKKYLDTYNSQLFLNTRLHISHFFRWHNI